MKIATTKNVNDPSKDEKIIQSNNIATVFLLRKDGGALLQLRDNKPGLREAGRWVPPGGGIELGESAEVAAQRELLEETEYDCDELHFLTSFEQQIEGWSPYKLSVFWGIYDGKQSVQCHEGQDLRFVKRQHAPQYKISTKLLYLWDQALKDAKSLLETSI